MSSSSSVDLSETRQPNLYAAVSVTYFAALGFVALRFWSRHLKAAGYWLDDYFMLVALTAGLGLTANSYWWIPRGFGRHREAFGPDVDYYFFLGFYIAELTYTFVIVFVKYSILALYWRVFAHTSIRIPIWTLAAIVTSWGLATLFLSIFQCVPPQGFWDKSIDAHCGVNSQQFLFGISIPNIVTDIALLVLPIRYVLKLNTSTHQKALLSGTFLLGSFVCIASIMRLVSVATESTDPDFSWNWVNQGIWATTESNFAIISACLPTMRPVWAKVFKHHQSVSNTANNTPGIWTIGSRRNRQRIHKRWLQDSLMHDTTQDSEHPFIAMADSEVAFPLNSHASSAGHLARAANTKSIV